MPTVQTINLKLGRQVALWLAIIIVLTYFVARPALQQLQVSLLQLQNTRNSLESLELELANLRAFRQTYALGLNIQQEINAHRQTVANLSAQLGDAKAANLDELSAQITLEQAKIQQLRAQLASYNLTDLGQVDEYFTNQSLPLETITFLEKAAADSNIATSLTPLPLKVNEKNMLRFSLTAQAEGPALFAFVERIENWPLLLETENVAITKLTDKEHENTDIAKMALTFKVHTR